MRSSSSSSSRMDENGDEFKNEEEEEEDDDGGGAHLQSFGSQGFQLIIITHDPTFVEMMRMELSTQAGVSLPEYYLRVYREDVMGVLRSRVDRQDWDEL